MDRRQRGGFKDVPVLVSDFRDDIVHCRKKIVRNTIANTFFYIFWIMIVMYNLVELQSRTMSFLYHDWHVREVFIAKSSVVLNLAISVA